MGKLAVQCAGIELIDALLSGSFAFVLPGLDQYLRPLQSSSISSHHISDRRLPYLSSRPALPSHGGKTSISSHCNDDSTRRLQRHGMHFDLLLADSYQHNPCDGLNGSYNLMQRLGLPREIKPVNGCKSKPLQFALTAALCFVRSVHIVLSTLTHSIIWPGAGCLR